MMLAEPVEASSWVAGLWTVRPSVGAGLVDVRVIGLRHRFGTGSARWDSRVTRIAQTVRRGWRGQPSTTASAAGRDGWIDRARGLGLERRNQETQNQEQSSKSEFSVSVLGSQSWFVLGGNDDATLDEKYIRLHDNMRRRGSRAGALYGRRGQNDVLKVAHDTLGRRARLPPPAVYSETYPREERQQAARWAEWIGASTSLLRTMS